MNVPFLRRTSVARLFPVSRARARALVATCAAAVICAALVPAHAAEVDELKGKKQNVEKKIGEADHAHEEASAALQAANAALARAQTDLLDARAHLAQTRGELAAAQALDDLMQRRLDAAKERLRKAERRLAAGEAEVARQRDDLRAMVVSSYEQGAPSLMGLSMVFSNQDPARIAGNMNTTATVANKESAILDGLQATEVMLAVHRAETAAAKKEVALRRQQAADNLTLKQALEKQAEAAESQVSKLVSLRSRARDAAAKAKKADMAVLKGLIVERERIEQLIFVQASRGAGYTGPIKGNGFLSMPVTGYVTSPFGYRIHPIHGYRNLHDGIDFGAPCGSPIRATAAGRVLTQYYHTAYGNRLVIDHGVRHGVGVATISNHLSSYAVATGEKVKRGQVIGYVGNTGWSTGCHLHFTVLENGGVVNPVKWL
jgi:murein DD-endopeptidase MepM/ murein hydrolase activator NlpD